MGMTIDEAIKILSDAAYGGVLTFDQDFKDAMKLGIEALKCIKIWRLSKVLNPKNLLVGETTD